MINKERIKLLPVWNITEPHPAFYDIDSKTAVGQTARVYATMLELQEDYNSFVSEINICITDFINNVNEDQECFKNQITKIMHDYIAMLDEKIKLQDQEIQESIIYIKENLEEGVKDAINQMKESGDLEKVIVDAFDNLGGRVITLENEINENNQRLENVQLNNAKLEKTFLHCFWKDDDMNPNFYVSKDGLNLNKLNIPYNDFPFDVKDMDIKYHNGKFYLSSTFMTEGADMYIGISTDLINWEHHYINLGLYDSNNINRWAPSLLFKDDELYISISKQYGKATNPTTETIDPTYDIFIAKCNDLENLTFDAPYKITLDGDGKSANRNHIDSSILFNPKDNLYYMAVKNEDTKMNEIFTSSNLVDWSLIKTLDILPKWCEGISIELANGEFYIYTDKYWSDYSTNKQKQLFTKTKDFINFTKPKILNIENSYAIDGKARHGSCISIDDYNAITLLSAFEGFDFSSSYEMLDDIVLYEGDSATSIVLTDSVENYSEVYVELHEEGNNITVTEVLKNPNLKSIFKNFTTLNDDGCYLMSVHGTFEGNQFKIENNYGCVIRSTEYNRYRENPLYIRKITGKY